MNMLRPRTSLSPLVMVLAIALPTLSGCLGTEQETTVTPVTPDPAPAGAVEPGAEAPAGPGDIDPSQK